jgi:hypothetical protein
MTAIKEVVEQNLTDGYILPADAQQTLDNASASGVGSW